MPPSNKHPGWTPKELRPLISFIARKCAEAHDFVALTEVCRIYMEEKPTKRTMWALRAQAKLHLTTKIDDLDEFELDAKVTMLYKLQIAPHEMFLIKMLQNAEVKLDKLNRITWYAAKKAGGLQLGSQETTPRRRKTKRPSRRAQVDEEDEEMEEEVEDDYEPEFMGFYPNSRAIPRQVQEGSEQGSSSSSDNVQFVYSSQEYLPRNYDGFKREFEQKVEPDHNYANFVKVEPQDFHETPHRPRVDFTEEPEEPMYGDISQRNNRIHTNSTTASEFSLTSARQFEQNRRHQHLPSSSSMMRRDAKNDFINSRTLVKHLHSLVTTMNSPTLNGIEEELRSKQIRGDETISSEDVTLAFKATLRMVTKDAITNADFSRSYSLSKMLTLLLNIVNYLDSSALFGLQEELRKTSEECEDKGFRIPIETVVRALKTTVSLCTPAC